MNSGVVAALALVGLASSACVSGPFDGDVKGGKKSDKIEITGLAPKNATVGIEFLEPNGFDWVPLESTKATGDSVTLQNGEVWYNWRASVVVPRWTDSCGVHDTSLRARFDSEEQVIAPSSGLITQLSAADVNAEHLLTLKFLGRDASDSRAQGVIKSSKIDTCFAIQAAIPVASSF
jgi:hypothetical protein